MTRAKGGSGRNGTLQNNGGTGVRDLAAGKTAVCPGEGNAGIRRR